VGETEGEEESSGRILLHPVALHFVVQQMSLIHRVTCNASFQILTRFLVSHNAFSPTILKDLMMTNVGRNM
jgi:hypothetical protein